MTVGILTLPTMRNQIVLETYVMSVTNVLDHSFSSGFSFGTFRPMQFRLLLKL